MSSVVLATEWGNGADAIRMYDIVEQDLALPVEEVHVWRARLDGDSATLHGLLSEDERERAARFRFERDRSRYVVGRAVLRRLLGGYSGRPAAELRFRYGTNEKPYLPGSDVWFNVSHSGPVALFAFSGAGELGIDIELEGPDVARERVAEHFFAPGEVRRLRAVPEALQARAFLHCWTRKEAFIKARGDGLSLALDSFEVSLGPDVPAELLWTAFSSEEAARWRLTDLSDPSAGYVAALATAAGELSIVTGEVTDIYDQGAEPGQEKL